MQTSFGSHDVFDDEFRGGVASRETVDGLDHLAIGNPLVLEILGPAVIDVVYSGNLVESIDTLVTSRQTLFEMRTGVP